MQVRHLTRRLTTAVAATSVAGLLAGSLAVGQGSATAATAQAKQANLGNTSIATVLAADSGFDRTARDFDVTEAAVLAVLDAKPNSAVKLLTQGRKRATVFAPTDAAFVRLVADLTGNKPRNERVAFTRLARLVDIDTIEQILLYHVVPGRTLGSGKVLAADGGRVETALGKHLRVTVANQVILGDADRNSRNARVKILDINKGNKQIAHGISQVLRPIDL